MDIFNKKKNELVSDANAAEPILNFLSHNYQRINIARLKHLHGLKLGIENKKVIDLGAGIGDHTLFYLFRNCNVVPVEGRQDLVNFIKFRFGLDAKCVDFEKELNLLGQFKDFDFVHCFGLLYHLDNPEQFLNVVAGVGNTLLLETMVSPTSNDNVNLILEDKLNSTQAISGMGCRPDRNWLFNMLKKNFEFVYVPLTQPNHVQFPEDWQNIPAGTTHTRVVFIASHSPIKSDMLTQELITKQSKMK